MSDETCDDCGEPIHSPLVKDGDAVEIGCSITPGDSVGVVVMRHVESNERRILLEVAEAADGMDGLQEKLAELAMEGYVFGKCMLLAADARKLAAALLDQADRCDGLELTTTTDWDNFK